MLAVVIGTGVAYLALTAGYWPEVDRLRPVPAGPLAGIVAGLPLAAAAAGWTLAGREPPAVARQALD